MRPDNTSTPPPMLLVIVILMMASAVSIMSTDMYAPSLPDLVEWFDTTPALVQLTISLNMLAFGLAQLLHGPLSDRYGRRPVLLTSLLVVALLCLACAMARSIEQLILFRVLLGTAAAAEAVVGLAVLKDLYDSRTLVKALALIGMVIAIVPAIAPIIGGFVHVRFGWQVNFYLIAGMALLAFVAVLRFLPESTEKDPEGLQASRVFSAYGRLLKDRNFLAHSLMLGCALGLIFVFVTSAPFQLIDRLGVSPDRFGYYQGAIVLTFFCGSLLASRLAESWNPDTLLALGGVIVLCGAISFLLCAGFAETSTLSITLPYCIMTFGMGPLFAVAPSHALRSVQSQAGVASALLSGIEQIIAGLSAVAVSLLHDGSLRPMVLVVLVIMLLLAPLLGVSRQLRAQFDESLES